MLEIVIPLSCERLKIKTILFDFDGTLSTLRSGWESVMAPMMYETLSACPLAPPDLKKRIDDYIEESTGIQTIFQMQWLADRVREWGQEPLDPWSYKEEYNRRLMQIVSQRCDAIRQGKLDRDQFLIAGSRDFLTAIKGKGLRLIVASGTDQPDVVQEAEILGLAEYFDEIAGAPLGLACCSKERVIQDLIHEHHLQGQELAVIGDGKVEISLAREVDGLALGVASDEMALRGVNKAKRDRLIAAGAHAITGDFLIKEEIMEWLQI